MRWHLADRVIAHHGSDRRLLGPVADAAYDRRRADPPASGRERVLDAAYDLFSRSGVASVGVDAVIAQAGVAKATLYRNFASKDELAIAFLERREERWTFGWLAAEVQRRSDDPRERLLSIFDVFGEWFAHARLRGLRVHQRDAGARRPRQRRAPGDRSATCRNIRDVRRRARRRARGSSDTDGFARQWHILMKGSIVAAGRGRRAGGGAGARDGRAAAVHHGV